MLNPVPESAMETLMILIASVAMILGPALLAPVATDEDDECLSYTPIHISPTAGPHP